MGITSWPVKMKLDPDFRPSNPREFFAAIGERRGPMAFRYSFASSLSSTTSTLHGDPERNAYSSDAEYLHAILSKLEHCISSRLIQGNQ